MRGDFEEHVLADGEALETFGFFPVDTLRFHAFRQAASGTPATDITVGVSYPGGVRLLGAVGDGTGGQQGLRTEKRATPRLRSRGVGAEGGALALRP